MPPLLLYTLMMNDPQCNVLLLIMEPVSGAFQNGMMMGITIHIEEGWYPEMYARIRRKTSISQRETML